jgi:hypothetical protein
VDRLQDALDAAGIPVWRDTSNLWPGEDRRLQIRKAIKSGSLVFIACFSENSERKDFSSQNQELLLAVEEMRSRRPGLAWLIPVRFAECSIPDFDLGAGRMLDSLQHVDLFDSTWEHGIARIIGAVYRILGGAPAAGITHEPADAGRSGSQAPALSDRWRKSADAARDGERRDAEENPVVLYSTNTWLSFAIAQKYYNGEHYVWCTPYFDPGSLSDRDSAVALTSSPLEIYLSLAEEVAHPDHPGRRIEENRAGILRGSNTKRQSGEISALQERDIVSIVGLAAHTYFKPLLYVIPYSAVSDRIREPPPGDKAHPLAAEYIIDRLPRSHFDVIRLEVSNGIRSAAIAP